MLAGRARPRPGRHVPVPHRARHRGAHEPGPAGAARHRGPGPLLRPHRPAARARRGRRRPTLAGRVLPHRPPGRLGPGPRAAGGRLAGPGGRALLPGHRARPPGPGPPPPPGRAGPDGARARGRVLRRPRRPPGAARPRWRRRQPGPGRRGAPARPTAWCSAGPGALLAALGQARTGHMGDIIGTIQREQDEIIRSPLAGVLVVQGGPGTGKTAVALHRAAYLLYTHRFPLERQGVLVVGPNPLFLRYIEQVLPSLGETGVTLSTVAGLVPEIRVRGRDEPTWPAEGRRAHGQGARPGRAHPPATAAPRRRGPLRRGRAAPAGPTDRGHRRHGAPPARHPQRPAALRRGAGGARPGRRVPGPARAAAATRRGERRRRRRRSRPTWPQTAAPACPRWPRRSTGCGRASRPTSSSTTCSGARPLLARRARGSSAPAEVQRLYRPRSTSLDAVPWTAADAALVDEARTLLGPRGAAGADRVRAQRAEEGRRRSGFWPQGLAASRLRAEPGRRRRGRGPLLRPHRGRRGPGPLPDAAADAGPPLALGLHDGGGRHRPGHRALGPAELGRRGPPPQPAAPAAAGGADRQLPHAGRGRGAGRPGAGRGGADHHAAPPGAPVGRPPRGSSPATRGRAGRQPWPRWPGRRWRRWPRAGWRCWARPCCCPS